MTRALKDMLQALADVGGVTSPYERTLMRPFALILTVVLLRGAVPQTAQMQTRLQSRDLLKLRAVTAVELSPDGARAAYVVDNNDGLGRPYGQVWVMTFADGKSVRFDADRDSSDDPHWSPDGRWIAYHGRVGEKSGLVIAKPDGSGATLLAEVAGTNAPLPGSSTSPT